MKRNSLLALDMLRKEEISSLRGGTAKIKKCGCVCVGPLSLSKAESDLLEREVTSSDGDCTDCGAANAHRAQN